MSTAPEEVPDLHAQALEYLDRGWSIIPIRPDTKRPCIEWREFQERHPTEDEVERWFDTWPDAQLALVTGAISGFVVVDCDNEEALRLAIASGMDSPIRVRTKNGHHLYFRHPLDGVRRGPRAGVNSRGVDWPKIPGLDFRGDGSYALLPPSRNYTWAIPAEHEIDDAPVWKDWKPTATVYDIRTGRPFEFSDIDLTHVPGLDDGFVSEWDRTAAYMKEHFPDGKLPTGKGHGRNERVMRYASELVMQGVFGAELRVKARAFMREFFLDPLADAEFEATCRSMEEAERRNHPERFAPDGSYIYRKPIPPQDSGPAKRLIFASDAEALVAKAKTREMLIDPWLPAGGTIVQVFGYSGHGKSLVLQHCLYALAAGQRRWGPFELGKPARVLTLDFENGARTIGQRLTEMKALYGDAEDRYAIWTPFSDEDFTLRTAEGLTKLEEWVKWYRPDVLVIDTIRSAWPGMEENDAKEWAAVNRLALRLRNVGIAVILLHHSNKPGQDGLGREAGSTNQLTTLETQIRVTQVFEEEATAKMKGGVWDGAYPVQVFPKLAEKMPPGTSMSTVIELSFGKVREWTDAHEQRQWVAWGRTPDGDPAFAGSSSPKQKAKELALAGYDPADIARAVGRPLFVIREWLEIA